MIVQSRLCLPGNCLLRPMQQTKIKNWIASIEDQFQDEEIQHKLPHTYAIRTIGNGLYLIFPNVGAYYINRRKIIMLETERSPQIGINLHTFVDR